LCCKSALETCRDAERHLAWLAGWQVVPPASSIDARIGCVVWRFLSHAVGLNDFRKLQKRDEKGGKRWETVKREGATVSLSVGSIERKKYERKTLSIHTSIQVTLDQQNDMKKTIMTAPGDDGVVRRNSSGTERRARERKKERKKERKRERKKERKKERGMLGKTTKDGCAFLHESMCWLQSSGRHASSG